MSDRTFGLLHRQQDRLVELLGSSVEGRATLINGMLQRNASEATSYWLQIVVAMGIATLGLVVGSTAVIIGAMLVAPLMGPIVALAMGLATGSPFLVLRSAGRIVLSIVVVVGGAGLITLLLPFHELNAEIAARTSPTVLDLLTAGFCALAGVYASLRPGSDTAATAAGTSIGISLVPPLCASGYGVGSGLWQVASGAALLFLTNLVAIIFVGTVMFVAAGFNRVDATTLERDALATTEHAPLTGAIARRLARLFESKAGPALRFMMPLVLLAAVYVPLRRALDEVAWEVRARSAVKIALGAESHKVVQTRVRVERHEIEVLVVLVGTTSDAETSRAGLEAEIRRASGVAPRVEVLAIPDAAAMAGLESSLLSARALPSALPPPPAAEQVERGHALVRASVMRVWPSSAVGEPLAIDIGSVDKGLFVRVVHQGPPLGPDAVESLRRNLGAELERDVHLADSALPAERLTRADGDLKLIARVAAAVAASAALPDVRMCVTQPMPTSSRRRGDPRDHELLDAMSDLELRFPRVMTETGDDWAVRFVRGDCPTTAKPDAGAPEAGTTDGGARR